MSVVRTWVFPVLRLVIWAVIAVALVVLAFRGGTGGSVDPAGATGAPGVDLGSPEIPVARGTVTNTVSVQGSVVADTAVLVKATAAGTVSRLHVAAGATVAAGDKLLDVRYEEERPPVVGKDAEGNPTSTPRDPLVKVVTVTAPVAGRLATLDVLKDQVVAVGDKVGTVSAGTLSVTAPLTQAEQFRLLSPPSTAQVTVTGGPAPFTCTGLTLGVPEGQADAGSAGTDPMTGAPISATTTARCAVPAGTTVFSGMAATVAIQAGEATDVLVVPVTAVQGSVQTGRVWVPGADGTPEERPVTLGLTDGEQVEITGGLTEGEPVLQFVPVPDDSAAGPAGMGGPYG
ncbi:efflux RND transporter periplasmic adaptor subunit [Modestobacter versicolor]|uniref:Multidrug efflux pump subunit AcrA (Membrane-fusion protein) n=1 Tax=Modestobacter versicolor TaxID=429133 RepID=A0A323VE50_9ACTN|nr:HlyD family efflux transporter periplasmic adaptor subunit [Modestobacter versicolor]MBB3674558.1 multidrug efflux pump subunit AcrA (membrane-fusion protein) [Modestobacter versicolor]PZA23144.1 secretion protein HlyD [Modestobacter versicolor]